MLHGRVNQESIVDHESASSYTKTVITITFIIFLYDPPYDRSNHVLAGSRLNDLLTPNYQILFRIAYHMCLDVNPQSSLFLT